MSISIKNITISINGTQSKKFKIDINGAQYNLDDFKLTQRLLEPNTLTFRMVKNPMEDINEPQFTACSSIIGTALSLNIQTESTEKEMTDFEEKDQTADIEFEGIITSATASRVRSEYVIEVEARSYDVLLMDNPSCKSFENKTLQDIVSDVFTDVNVDKKVDPRYTDTIPYTVQYNETHYEFICRLAQRYGEWVYHDGKDFIYGKLPESKAVELSYPSKDVPRYGVRMKMQHVGFFQIASSYNSNKFDIVDGHDEMVDSVNALNDSVFKASDDQLRHSTLQNMHSGGFADAESFGKILEVAYKTQGHGERTNMLFYEGKTYCSTIKIGGKLVIKDNYIASEESANKSDVNQDEIRIIGMEHVFTADEQYSNSFVGISSACDYPPYLGKEVYPYCPSCRAKVTDNEDPNKLGRIRVQFNWQNALDEENMKTPWLRIVQPHGGVGKGFSFIPEIGEEVMVNFEYDNAEKPYVTGALFNGKDKPDDKWLIEKNEVKGIRTKNGHTIEFHDKGSKGYISIYDNDGHTYEIKLSSSDQCITINADKDISLHAKNDISLTADHDIKMTAKNDMKVEVNNNMSTQVTNQKSVDVQGNMETKVVNSISVNSNDYTQTATNMYYLDSGAMVCSGTQAIMLTTKMNFQVESTTSIINAKTTFSCTSATVNLTASAAMSLTSTGVLNLQGTVINMN